MNLDTVRNPSETVQPNEDLGDRDGLEVIKTNLSYLIQNKTTWNKLKNVDT